MRTTTPWSSEFRRQSARARRSFLPRVTSFIWAFRPREASHRKSGPLDRRSEPRTFAADRNLVHSEETMRKRLGIGCFVALAIMLTACQSKQGSAPSTAQPTAENTPPLVLTGQVPLEGVKGRFDHFASGKGKVFVSALGNNTVEVIDLFQGALAHTITGVPNPQGVTFSPEANKLFVASEKGKVYIYDGDSYKLISTLDFDGGADNMRYDAATKRVYVGCGDSEKNSAIAAVDAMSNKRLDEVYKIGGEPESFQLEKNGPKIYVNVPDLKQIVVINRTTKALTRWS